MAKTAKKGKRVYTKKSARWGKNNEPTAVVVEPTDNELEQLVLICQVFDNWDDRQKVRALSYLNSKYEEFKS